MDARLRTREQILRRRWSGRLLREAVAIGAAPDIAGAAEVLRLSPWGYVGGCPPPRSTVVRWLLLFATRLEQDPCGNLSNAAGRAVEDLAKCTD